MRPRAAQAAASIRSCCSIDRACIGWMRSTASLGGPGGAASDIVGAAAQQPSVHQAQTQVMHHDWVNGRGQVGRGRRRIVGRGPIEMAIVIFMAQALPSFRRYLVAQSVSPPASMFSAACAA